MTKKLILMCVFSSLTTTALAAPKAKPDNSSELDAMRAEIDALWEAQAAVAPGSTFIRWGNTEVPTGMTALETGWGYVSRDDDDYEGGTTGPLLLPGPHPRDWVMDGIGQRARMAPVATIPPQVYFRRHEDTGVYSWPLLQGVRLYSSTPVATMWGDSPAPAGWELLYTGYVYGAASSTRQTDAICVDFTIEPAHYTGYSPDRIENVELLSYVAGPEQVSFWPELTCSVIRKL